MQHFILQTESSIEIHLPQRLVESCTALLILMMPNHLNSKGKMVEILET